MATFVFIHGAGSTGWYWHLVIPELRAAGHEAIAVDLPCDDDSAGLQAYTDTVVRAVGDRTGLVVVAQSLGGLIAPLVCDRLPVELLVYIAAMVPKPGETGADWWTNTRYDDARQEQFEETGIPIDNDPFVVFLHDVSDDVVAESEPHLRNQSSAIFADPWPLDSMPDVPTRFLLCRDDRFFPAAFQRRVVPERLGIIPDEMPGGHLPALAHPHALAERLLAYVAEAPVLQ